MNKSYLVVSLVVFFLVVGFLGSIFVFPKDFMSSTDMYCVCVGDGLGEANCNRVSVVDAYFFSGLVNVLRECGGFEVLVCEFEEVLEVRYDVSCQMGLYIGYFRVLPLSFVYDIVLE